MPLEPIGIESTAAEEERHERTRRSASPSNGERLSVQGSFLEPRRVVGDEGESAKTDLAALD